MPLALPIDDGMLGKISDARAWHLNRTKYESVRTKYWLFFLNMPPAVCTSPWCRTVPPYRSIGNEAECMEVGVEATRARSSSSGRECRERREPNRLEGRPCFWRLRGRDLVMSLSMLLLESARLIGVRGLEGAMSDVGELEGLEEKRVAGRLFLRSLASGGPSGGSSMGVNAEMEGGRKMLKDFLRCLGDD